MKKILNIGAWVITVAGILVLISFVQSEQNSSECVALEVHLTGPPEVRFVNEEDLIIQITDLGSPVVGSPVSDADIQKFERAVNAMPEVKDAEVYYTINGKVIVEAEKRVPIARIFNRDSTDFYLDEDGHTMPPSYKFTALVPVITGHLQEPQAGVSVADALANDSLQQVSLLDDIYELLGYIREHAPWDAQIQQIHVNQHGEFEFLPRVGGHRIMFGSTERMEEKFDNLFRFCTQGLRNEDWRLYDTINVKFKDQIVCTYK